MNGINRDTHQCMEWRHTHMWNGDHEGVGIETCQNGGRGTGECVLWTLEIWETVRIKH